MGTRSVTDLQTVLRVLARSEPHVEPLRPRGREYVLMLIAVVLAAVVFL
jgi:hypothetical protein